MDKIAHVLTQYGSTSHLPLAAKAFSKFEYPGCLQAQRYKKAEAHSKRSVKICKQHVNTNMNGELKGMQGSRRK